jgi:hypothetical protein
MKHFEALKQELKKDNTPRGIVIQQPTKGTGTRAGKKTVAGHFSELFSKTINLLAVEEGTSVQALLGEGFDKVLASRGRHPLGER